MSPSLIKTAMHKWGVLLAVLCTLHLTAHAGLFDDDEARLAIKDLRQNSTDLRAQVDALKRDTELESQRTAEEKTQLRRSLLDLQNQLESTRAELAKIRGQEEQLTRDLAEMQRRQIDISQSTDARLSKFEPTKVMLDGIEFLVEPTEKKSFELGLSIFRKGDFSNAQVAFADFLNRYPQTGYRPTALFWLGNAQYATKNYKDALINFRSLIASAPGHLRIPEAALAIANCQFEMKEVKAARRTLEELVSAHPGTEAAVAAKDRLARFK
jgi:tol-pal system protein YbgF